MFENIFTVDIELVKKVKWTGDSQEYDLALFQLGQEHNRFLIQNPISSNLKCLHYFDLPSLDDDSCIVILYEGEWIGKIFSKRWLLKKGYCEVEVQKPKYVWNKNQHLDRLMTFVDDPFPNYEPEPYDCHYKLVWYIDPKFNPLEERVWALTLTPLGGKIRGEKDMGYVFPEVEYEINEDLPDMGLNVEDYCPPYYMLNYECVYYLNKIYSPDPSWVFKFRPTYRKTKEIANCGEISPNFQITYNPEIGELDYELDYVVSLDELNFEHVWMLDRKHLSPNSDDIWAFSLSIPHLVNSHKVVDYISPTPIIEQNSKWGDVEFQIDYNIPLEDFDKENVWLLDKKHQPNGEEDEWAVSVRFKDVEDSKVVGYISPRHFYEYNPALPNMDFNVNYVIPWYDFEFLHKWMLDPKFSNVNDKIWATKLTLTFDHKGEKEIGYISPIIKDNLDVIFISYHEPNAEENWQRVLEKAPWAKRVDGVEGIFEAHRQAALLSETDMFYVVDGDAWLVDDWTFDYQPGIFDRDCAYVWHSQNPINGLEYGYGGVKLFSKSMMLNAKGMTKLDMTTSVMPKLKVMDKVSNETRFNVDEFSTWRSAFRECVKLYYNFRMFPEQSDHENRLYRWVIGDYGNFSNISKIAAIQAINYTRDNLDSYDLLLKINDRRWLLDFYQKQEFNNDYDLLNHLNENACWIIMDPWETSLQEDIKEYPNLEIDNRKILGKILNYLPNIKHCVINSSFELDVYKELSGFKNLLSNKNNLDNYMIENKLDSIVYIGYHSGLCIVDNSIGARNTSRDYRCFYKSDLVAEFPTRIAKEYSEFRNILWMKKLK